MPVLLIALALAAPAKKHWSKDLGVGIWFPNTWSVVEGAKGPAVVVVKGPKLGKGHPRLALIRAGTGGGLGLEDFSKRLIEQLQQRPTWTVTAKVRKQLGPYPAMRIGFRFLQGKSKGRARATVVLLGREYYVLELSAPASHFPGSIFDRIEKSLEIKWTAHELEGGLAVRAPHDWPGKLSPDGRLVLSGPRFGDAGAAVFFKSGLSKIAKTAKPGPKIKFLDGSRETWVDEKKFGDGPLLRMLIVNHGSWSSAVVMPAARWNDVFPLAAAIVGSAGVPQPRDDD